jgi:Protein of unknown function (DUF3631)
MSPDEHPGLVAAKRFAAESEANSATNGDGLALLDELRDTLKRYTAFRDEHSVCAVALWIATTHALPAFDCAPRLAITSPEKRCGKTRLLDIIDGTCHRPLATADATVAAIFRSLGGAHPPTLLIDEADTLWGSKKLAEQNEDLRKLINAGHQRGRPALRCVGPNQIPTPFPVFAMAALAGIGSLPDTITDRAINVAMRRRSRDEKVAQFRSRRDSPILENLRVRLAQWVTGVLDDLSKAEPEMPVEDRAADTWEPLIAVADAAGGHWPKTARAACNALVDRADDVDEEGSLNTKLLTDIKHVFAEKGVAFLPSADLVAELRRVEESPWNDFELTARKLAFRLKDFGIKSGRGERNTVRGYALDAFFDAFSRYIRPQPSKPSTTGVELQQPVDGSESVDGSIRPRENIRPHERPVQALFEDGWTDEDGGPPVAAGNGTPDGTGYRRHGCVCIGQPKPCYHCSQLASKQQDGAK